MAGAVERIKAALDAGMKAKSLVELEKLEAVAPAEEGKVFRKQLVSLKPEDVIELCGGSTDLVALALKKGCTVAVAEQPGVRVAVQVENVLYMLGLTGQPPESVAVRLSP